MSEGDVAFACAQAFVSTLARFGLTDACLSPGSRSTPIALALARNQQIRVHVHLDERASAFFALGLAKASNRPVVVACTSGTAAANLLPAVVEASMARVPLIVLTADRPPELRGVGANQTIDQVELFGGYVRWFADAPLPTEGSDVARAWVGLAAQTHGRACSPGPVHVNLPYREPLVPAGEPVRLGSVTTASGGTVLDEGAFPTEGDVDAFVRTIRGTRRGVLYLGGLRSPSPSVVELGKRLGWPVIAEPTSGLRVPGTLAAGQFLLSNPDFSDAHVPDVVLQFGAAPTSRAALDLVGGAGQLVIVDPDDVVADPHRRAERRFVVHAGELAHAAAADLEERPAETWFAEWVDADARARLAIDEKIDASEKPSEGRVARDLAVSLPDGSTLVVGSSMPVRDLDAYMLPRDGLRVLANRGASGIDGFVSTALGVAASGAPTAAYCGDLTLLHDVGALLWSARRGHDTVFVVPNNDGGVIFSFLAQKDLPELEELFTTPHGLDFVSICAAAEAGHARVERADELVPAIETARTAGGVHVVEVPIDREDNVRRHAEVHAAVAEALRR
ncbi:MAG: 2-succinyl-5-enolpyruvyl-6-hydroxy-3-cyclohexene-1-carboxylic-acid synthase [Actinomycetota bacterium]